MARDGYGILQGHRRRASLRAADAWAVEKPLLLRLHDRGGVDLDDHLRERQRGDADQRVGGELDAAPGLADALAEREPVAQVRDVGRDLHHVGERRAVVGEHALDLVVGVLALLKEIAVVPDVAALAVLILGADPGEIDELGVADAGYRHRLGENALGPFAVVEFLDLDAALLSLAWCADETEDAQQHEVSHDRHLKPPNARGCNMAL